VYFVIGAAYLPGFGQAYHSTHPRCGATISDLQLTMERVTVAAQAPGQQVRQRPPRNWVMVSENTDIACCGGEPVVTHDGATFAVQQSGHAEVDVGVMNVPPMLLAYRGQAEDPGWGSQTKKPRREKLLGHISTVGAPDASSQPPAGDFMVSYLSTKSTSFAACEGFFVFFAPQGLWRRQPALMWLIIDHLCIGLHLLRDVGPIWLSCVRTYVRTSRTFENSLVRELIDVRTAHMAEAQMTRTRQEQCVVSATPSVSQRAQPGVLPPGAPLHFHWRGYRYRVLDILGHWLDTAPWWWQLQHVSQPGLNPGPAPGPVQPGIHTPQDDQVLRQRKRRVWQVEAVHQYTSQPGVYELAQDVDGGQWWLLRVWD
jgi:hypothetical protein